MGKYANKYINLLRKHMIQRCVYHNPDFCRDC